MVVRTAKTALRDRLVGQSTCVYTSVSSIQVAKKPGLNAMATAQYVHVTTEMKLATTVFIYYSMPQHSHGGPLL